MNRFKDGYIVEQPNTIRFKAIHKKKAARGFVFLMWDRERLDILWFGQCMASLMDAVKQHHIQNPSTKQYHKGWRGTRRNITDLEELNAFIPRFPQVNVVCKRPRDWKFTEGTPRTPPPSPQASSVESRTDP